jgi:hypothetical protein
MEESIILNQCGYNNEYDDDDNNNNNNNNNADGEGKGKLVPVLRLPSTVP